MAKKPIEVDEEEEFDEDEEVVEEEEEDEVDEAPPVVTSAAVPKPPRRKRQKRVGVGAAPAITATDAHLYWAQLLSTTVAADPSIGGAGGVTCTVKREVNGQLQLCGVIDGAVIEGDATTDASEACLNYVLEHYHCYTPQGQGGKFKLYFTRKRGGTFIGQSNLVLPPYDIMLRMRQSNQTSGYGMPSEVRQQPLQQQQPAPQSPPQYQMPPSSLQGYGQPQASGESPATMALIQGMLQQMQQMSNAIAQLNRSGSVAQPAQPPQVIKAGMTVEDVAKAVAQLQGLGIAVGAGAPQPTAAPPRHAPMDPIEAAEDAMNKLHRLMRLSKTVEARFGAGAPPVEAVAIPVVEEEEKEEKVEYPYENVQVPDGAGGAATLFGHPAVIPMKKKKDGEEEADEESIFDKAGRFVMANPGILEVGIGAVSKLVEGVGAYAASKAQATNKIAAAVGAGKVGQISAADQPSSPSAEKVNHIPYDAVDAGSGDEKPPVPQI